MKVFLRLAFSITRISLWLKLTSHLISDEEIPIPHMCWKYLISIQLRLIIGNEKFFCYRPTTIWCKSKHSSSPSSPILCLFTVSLFRAAWSFTRCCLSLDSIFAGKLCKIWYSTFEKHRHFKQSAKIMPDLLGNGSDIDSRRRRSFETANEANLSTMVRSSSLSVAFFAASLKIATVTLIAQNISGQDSESWLLSALLPSLHYAWTTE